jgi:hypothetical protein
VNAPYPTQLQLRADSAIGALLAEQAAATAAFVAIVKTAQTGFAALHFPLGSPALGFDLEDITETLSDWQNAREEARLEETAEDLVLERLGA